MDKTKIEQQAKKIMDEFLLVLGKIDQLPYELGTERPSSMRKDGATQTDNGFSSRMLENAPKIKDNCIVAEKKKW
ncbi:hypothetical protein HY639_00705 [Candidatus Woesearchaeota archaeon]|nr:hypothetical protein [Candidatus Woesearchaeota archaeon]